jgi:SAM-dependent methyltransferase
MAIDYATYLKMQTAGPVEKPEHYFMAEKKTIDYLFRNISKDANILDVGCAMGLGMGYLNSLGYESVMGVELDTRKVDVSEFIVDIIVGDVAQYPADLYSEWDVIYCSHCLEHVWDADAAIERMKEITKPDADFFFIIPYPDFNPSPAHWSSIALGLDVDDSGMTVRNWFIDRGFVISEIKLDDFREPEIWFTMRKINDSGDD